MYYIIDIAPFTADISLVSSSYNVMLCFNEHRVHFLVEHYLVNALLRSVRNIPLALPK